MTDDDFKFLFGFDKCTSCKTRSDKVSSEKKSQKLLKVSKGENTSMKVVSTGYLDNMNTEEAAQFLRVGKKRLLNMVSAGQIPYHKLGRSNRYRRSELEKLLTNNRRGPRYD